MSRLSWSVLRYGETVPAAAALLWVVLSILPAAEAESALAAAERIRVLDAAIAEGLAAVPAARPQPVDPVPAARARLSASGLPAAAEFPSWVMHRRPNVIYGYRPGPGHLFVVHGELEVEGPELVDAETGRARLTVTWHDGENTVLTAARVEVRCESGPWRTLRRLDPSRCLAGPVEVALTGLGQSRRYHWRIHTAVEVDRDCPAVRRRESRGPRVALPVGEGERITPAGTLVPPRRQIVVPVARRDPSLAELQAGDDRSRGAIEVWRLEKGRWRRAMRRNVIEGERVDGVGTVEALVQDGTMPHPANPSYTVPRYRLTLVAEDGFRERFASDDRPGR